MYSFVMFIVSRTQLVIIGLDRPKRVARGSSLCAMNYGCGYWPKSLLFVESATTGV